MSKIKIRTKFGFGKPDKDKKVNVRTAISNTKKTIYRLFSKKNKKHNKTKDVKSNI